MMNLSTVLFSAFIYLISSANVWAVPSCAKLNELWKTKYYSDFNVQLRFEKFPCPGPTSDLVKTFHALDAITFNPPKSGENPPKFYKWVTSIITRTEYKAVHSKYPNATASSSGGILWIHDNYFRQNLEWRTATLVHEARHSQSDDVGHVYCKHGTQKGEYSCDENFFGGKFEGSGYNFAFVFYWWIAKAAKSTELRKSKARAHMKSLLLNRFNGIKNEDIKKFFP